VTFFCNVFGEVNMIKAGTILNENGVVFKVLEDTTSHGCPLVEIIHPGGTNFKIGDKTYRTINQENK